MKARATLTKAINSACDKQKEVVIELHEYGRKYGVLKKKTPILSRTVSLQDDVLYTEETFRSE